MHLKELTIYGFKSFAKKSELEFSAPITAIVGPNGSGKSNVAEAFRFVLGEQSIKSMRGKRGEDLIFNGSESISRANRASVAVALRNEEKNGTRTFPLDFDEITIERVVHRDGTNEYLLNGSKTRLKDVQELLTAAHIGPSGHHIISQGEGDRILTASPRERREMIEDALGLKIYQYKKAESERKLAKTKENIEQVESLRKEVQPHLAFLKRQVKKIERSLELQETLKNFYTEYLKREDVYIAYHHDRLTREKHEPEKRRDELREMLEEAKNKLEQSENDEKRDALIDLEKKMSAVREKRQEVVHRGGQLDGQMSLLMRRIEERKKKSGEERISHISYDEFKRVSDTIEHTVEGAIESDDVSILRRALTDILHSLHTFVKHTKGTDKTDETDAEENELAVLSKDKKTSDRELSEVEQEEHELAQVYNELKTSIEKETSRGHEAEREVFKIMSEEREIEQELSRIDRELNVLERDRNEFKRELEEAVSLLGRDASAYFEHVIKGKGGTELSREEIVDDDRECQRERRRELEKMKIRLEELGTGSNEDILKEYKDVKERDEFLVSEIADLEASVEKLEKLTRDLAEEINEQFVTGIEKIGTEFNRFFVLMFGGGTAALTRIKPIVRKKQEDVMAGLDDEVLEEDEEEAEEGIEIDVHLPNKRVRGLEMLSGGERALTSIALIFAMSQVNPPLFIVLDETDAALDEANSRRYGDMITALAERSQLILITHNRETMSRAGVLYGVTMGADGVSKLLSVKFDEAVTVAK